MTRVLTEAQAQADFSELITAACQGEKVIITRNGQLAVEFNAIAKPVATENRQEELLRKREKAVAAIKAHRKGSIIGVPFTIDEIISARDEGRRY